MDLGRLRISANYRGNLIEVYNAPRLCSLVVNGRVADTFDGAVAVKFVLRGSVETPEGALPVEARMSPWTAVMRLFCGDELLGKKWMPFG